MPQVSRDLHKPYHPIRGVLLDIDGTLLDSNDAHALAWVDALEEHEFQVQFERVRKLIGMGGDKLLPEMTGLSKDSPAGKRISQRRSQIFKARYLPVVRPFYGAQELLRRMRATGLKLSVATSAQPDELRALLDRGGLTGLIEVAASSGDASNSKPDPDIVQAALKKSGFAPSEALMLGDTPYDIEAAKKAGVECVALRCGGWSDADLAGAIKIYNDPADLLTHYTESPFNLSVAVR